MLLGGSAPCASPWFIMADALIASFVEVDCYDILTEMQLRIKSSRWDLSVYRDAVAQAGEVHIDTMRVLLERHYDSVHQCKWLQQRREGPAPKGKGANGAPQEATNNIVKVLNPFPARIGQLDAAPPKAAPRTGAHAAGGDARTSRACPASGHRAEAQEAAENTEQGKNFRTLLFTKIIPNLKRIGLLNDKVMPKYEQLGVLSYAELEDNFNIDWADMSKPYETQEEIERFISAPHH